MALSRILESFSSMNGWHATQRSGGMKFSPVKSTMPEGLPPNAGNGDSEEILANGDGPDNQTDFETASLTMCSATQLFASSTQLSGLPAAKHSVSSLHDLHLNKTPLPAALSSTTIAGSLMNGDVDIQEKYALTTKQPLGTVVNGYHRVQPNIVSADDSSVLHLLKTGKLKSYAIEHFVQDADRAVRLRRQFYSEFLQSKTVIDQIPYKNYPYIKVHRVCGENIVGYIPVKRCIAGPLLLDRQQFSVPLATHDPAIFASVNRGCRALSLCSAGVQSVILKDGMTRAPAIRFGSVLSAARAAAWVQQPDNFCSLKKQFDSTSRFAKLKEITPCLKDRDLYLRFVAFTGDAMGMNMVSKGVEKALELLRSQFVDIETIVLSGNYCIDKKVSCLNWIEGRGKSVVCEAVIRGDILRDVLGTTVDMMVNVSNVKLGGAELFGSVGGYSCRAADIVAAMFVATGQDIAQVGTSSMCLTSVDRYGIGGKDLYISCRMPSLEVGTVGGGTVLDAQGSSLAIMGVRGGASQLPGENARRLSRLICATVLAGEVALLAELATIATLNYADAELLHAGVVVCGGSDKINYAEGEYTTVPLGLAGPLLLDNNAYTVPLATTEGALIASINRGFKAIDKCGGACSVVFKDCMSFVVAIRFESVVTAAKAVEWIQDVRHFADLKTRFDSVDLNCCLSLNNITPCLKDRDLYLRFLASTGDSVGMQMVAQGAAKALDLMRAQFVADYIEMIVPNVGSANSNDATVSSVNWINGRGKSVVCEAVITGTVVETILKSTVSAMVQVNDIKNKGSDLAGSIGGFNCQAANIVAAMFIATGQNVAHVGTSSLCMTTVDRCGASGEDLYVSCRMPSLEVGTEGGYTSLKAHAGALGIMGLHPHIQHNSTAAPLAGENARRLACIVCATVLAGEISLLAALSEGTLVKSHEKLNRRKVLTPTSSALSLQQHTQSYAVNDANALPVISEHHRTKSAGFGDADGFFSSRMNGVVTNQSSELPVTSLAPTPAGWQPQSSVKTVALPR